jgi:hypothetical protein
MMIAPYRYPVFEFSFLPGIDQTWLLNCGRVARWFRVSFIDGGGRPVKYKDGMFEKFDKEVSDANQNETDSTLLFIATDGSRIYKAFAGPVSAVGDSDPYLSKGFDDDTYIGIWSHEWLRNRMPELEDQIDPDAGWGELMENMVVTMADFADSKS